MVDSIIEPEKLPQRDKYKPLDMHEKKFLERMIRTHKPKSQLMKA